MEEVCFQANQNVLKRFVGQRNPEAKVRVRRTPLSTRSGCRGSLRDSAKETSANTHLHE